MNVLHIYKTCILQSQGGVETFINTLCKFDSKLGIKNKILILSPNPKKDSIKLEGYEVFQAKQIFFLASTGFSITAFFQFKKLIKDIDIVHYHFPNPYADLLHLLCRPEQKTILTYHSDIIRQKIFLPFYKPLRNFFLNSLDKVIATSPNYYVTSEVLQKYSKKVSIIPIGIDHKKYESLDINRYDYWSNQFREPFFLFIGALRYYKGLHLALDAIKDTKINLVIAGANGVENKLKSQASKLKLDNVNFLGFVEEEDKIALLNLCYGFIFPSHLRSEAFGISLLEAASVGKPLISSEIGTGTTYVNIHNETGLVINPGSSMDLRNAMQYLLDNPVIAKKMGQSAKKRSKALFSGNDQAKSYYDLYNELVNG